MLRATQVIQAADSLIQIQPTDSVLLRHEERYKRRIVMQAENGLEFLLDLKQPAYLGDGDFLLLEDGGYIAVKAAPELVMQITAPLSHSLMRIIWHIGNRHLPCAIFKTHIFIQPDAVMENMVLQLGGEVAHIHAVFTPERGAYAHSHSNHSHSHENAG